jgi:flagellar hook protein FlgE
MPLTSFYTALTGLDNSSLAINVIGNNLANMNTTAFKSSTANFSELLAGLSGTSANGDPTVTGLGSTLNGITPENTQGTITSTGVSTDAAISGNGFFVVSTDGGLGFTRNGQFEFDQNGYLVSSDGFQVMGYPAANGKVNASGNLSAIQINQGQTIPATATTELSLTANLDSQAADNSTFGTAVQVYDSLGTAHTINFTFTRKAAGDWSWMATVPGADVAGGGTGPVTVGTSDSTDPAFDTGNSDITFDQNGQLNLSPTATNPTNPTQTIKIPGLTSGAADMTISFSLTDSSGNPLITDVASDSSVSSTVQNGSSATTLQSIDIESNGDIVGLMQNGQSVTLAQLALADFPNVDGLQKYQGSTFTPFTSSGQPSIGTAGSGGLGTIVGSSLEQSNVDMAQQFVSLIAAERAYQANSQVITTTDQLYQSTLNLKQ